MNEVILKPGRERSLLHRHPWVFSGAIERLTGDPAPGETVLVKDSGGQPLALAAFSPVSNIRLRIWSWDVMEKIGQEFFAKLIQRAISYRGLVLEAERQDARLPSAYRLIHAESDGLPGLVVDRYNATLVVQILSAGAEYWRDTFVQILRELLQPDCIYERSDVDVRGLEGLLPRVGVLWGSEPPPRLTIHERSLSFWVDPRAGHKTGFYLDQRMNRALVGRYAAGRDVMDCFSYTGGFTVSALASGANSATCIDASEDALHLARENLALNNLPLEKVAWIEGDAFHVLRKLRDQGKSFDMVILDPPKFAPTAAQAERASRGYKDINLLAFKLLRPGGILATFSCSGGISDELFGKIVFSAATDAGVNAQIISRLHQGVDHPVAVNFPEGAYLKGLLLMVN